MKPAVLSGPSRSTHRLILAALGIACAALTLLLWLHPTAGYADKHSIIAGADLRASLIFILWSAFAVFATVSTLIIAVARRVTARRAVQLVTGYAAAVATLPLFAIVVDKFV